MLFLRSEAVKNTKFKNFFLVFKVFLINFALPPSTKFPAHLIGHEGPGSLLSELKRRGWVSNLSAGDRCLARGFGNFTISVDLSEG